MKKVFYLYIILSSSIFSFSSYAFDLSILENMSSYPADLRHQLAFSLAADDLVQTNLVHDKTSEVSVLYPGAGSHIAVLELGNRLAEQHDKMKKVTFILTDIDDKKLLTTINYLRSLVAHYNKLIQFTVSTEKFEQGTETLIKFYDQNTSTHYHILYALNRSDPIKDKDPDINRIFYYRQSYFDQADVIIHHDSSNDRMPSTFFADFLTSLKQSENDKKRAFILEDMNQQYQVSYQEQWITYQLLPGKYNILNNVPFGCSFHDPNLNVDFNNHMGKPKYYGTAIFYPNNALWKSLSSFEIKSLVLLANTNDHPDTGPFLSDDASVVLESSSSILNKILIALNRVRKVLNENDLEQEKLLLYDKQIKKFKSIYK